MSVNSIMSEDEQGKFGLGRESDGGFMFCQSGRREGEGADCYSHPAQGALEVSGGNGNQVENKGAKKSLWLLRSQKGHIYNRELKKCPCLWGRRGEKTKYCTEGADGGMGRKAIPG